MTDITQGITRVNGKEYGYVAIPLLDFKGSDLGVFIAVKNFQYYARELNVVIIRAIIYTILQTVLLSGLLYFILSYMIFGELSSVLTRFNSHKKGGASEHHLAEAVHLHRVAQHHRIQPTAAPRASGRRAKFIPEILARPAQPITECA